MGVVGLPTTLNNLSGGSAVIRKFSTELRRKAVPSDFYTALRGEDVIYKGQTIQIPDKIYTKIKASDSAGANNVRVTLKMPLNGNILRGRAIAMGTEIQPIIKTGTIYRNNYRFVVQDEPGYGEDKLDAQPYRLYQEHVNDLSQHAKAEEGLEIRMALVESNGWNLQAGSTAATCPAQWNRNFYVIGCPTALQPTFHPNAATYTNRIVSAIQTAAGGPGANFIQTAAQMTTCNDLDNIIRWAFRRRMMPMTLNGRSGFVLSMSQLGAQRFSDPAFTDSLGARWSSVQRFTGAVDVQIWHGLIGKYEGPSATIWVTVDDRLPTLIPTGTGEPFGLAAGYVWPTDSDLRQLEGTTTRDAMILHGMGAVVNWDAEPMHLIQQDWDYNIRNGKGYAGVRGIQQLQYDNTPADPTGAAREYFGSAVIVAGRQEG